MSDQNKTVVAELDAARAALNVQNTAFDDRVALIEKSTAWYSRMARLRSIAFFLLGALSFNLVFGYAQGIAQMVLLGWSATAAFAVAALGGLYCYRQANRFHQELAGLRRAL